MNKVSLTGRIANDMEIKKTKNAKSILEFNIAVSRDRKNESGTYGVDFIRVACWEQRADFLNTYASKGTLIGLTGRIETNSYVNKEGQKVTQTYIQAEQVEILRQPNEKTEVKEQPKAKEPENDNFGGTSYGFEQEDLPFY